MNTPNQRLLAYLGACVAGQCKTGCIAVNLHCAAQGLLRARRHAATSSTAYMHTSALLHSQQRAPHLRHWPSCNSHCVVLRLCIGLLCRCC